MSTGGSILEISIRGRLFSVAADADVSTDLGGKTTEVEMNGNGTARYIQTRKQWMLEGITVDINKAKADLEFLQENADGDQGEEVVITIEYADGTVRRGKGRVTGDVKEGSASTTATINLGGGGKLELQ